MKDNKRRQKFFELYTNPDGPGLTLIDAYRKAGYKGKGGSAYASASRLAKTLDVWTELDRVFKKRHKEAHKKFMAIVENGINIDRVWKRAIKAKSSQK